MPINWTLVESEVEQAVEVVIGAAWRTVSTGASTQFAALIAAGRQIEQNRNTMSQPEYDSLKLMQQRALEGVLQTYAAISLDAAQQAAAAAWNALTAAIKSAYPAVALLL